MHFSQGTIGLLAAVFTVYQHQHHANVSLFADATEDSSSGSKNPPPVVVASQAVVVDTGILNATLTKFIQEHQAILGNYKTSTDAAATAAAAGILSSSSSNTMCSAGYIDCEDGYVKGSNPKKSCAEACNGKCCVGNAACNKFTGKVCQDGSCTGYWSACAYATIPKVVNSCHGYTWSCLSAGDGDDGATRVESIVNSCNNFFSCHMRNGITDVGHIIDSCNGDSACRFAGTTMNITSSCNDGFQACYYLGRNGAVGDATLSCNGNNACARIGVAEGNVNPPMNNCCNGDNACFERVLQDGSCQLLSAKPTTSPTKKPTKKPTPKPVQAMKPTSKPTKKPTSKPTKRK